MILMIREPILFPFHDNTGFQDNNISTSIHDDPERPYPDWKREHR